MNVKQMDSAVSLERRLGIKPNTRLYKSFEDIADMSDVEFTAYVSKLNGIRDRQALRRGSRSNSPMLKALKDAGCIA